MTGHWFRSKNYKKPENRARVLGAALKFAAGGKKQLPEVHVDMLEGARLWRGEQWGPWWVSGMVRIDLPP